ncbi:MAG: hypothetical protein LBU83_13850 [Bacteroidales bacterium]|jgi:hypothetical protein|nr:hypothetical protein [Bacteroidales bacterium]
MKKLIYAILCLLCIALSAITGIKLWGAEKGEASLKDNNYREEMVYTPARGILSTGVIYEFRGTMDFNEFREQNNFYLKRVANTTLIAQTPVEAAELGHFLLFPALRSRQQPLEYVEGESSIVVLHYCYKTDNWALQIEFPADSIVMGEPNIFTINRSTGYVVELSANRGSAFIRRWRRGKGGWRRVSSPP